MLPLNIDVVLNKHICLHKKYRKEGSLVYAIKDGKELVTLPVKDITFLNRLKSYIGLGALAGLKYKVATVASYLSQSCLFYQHNSSCVKFDKSAFYQRPRAMSELIELSKKAEAKGNLALSLVTFDSRNAAQIEVFPSCCNRVDNGNICFEKKERKPESFLFGVRKDFWGNQQLVKVKSDLVTKKNRVLSLFGMGPLAHISCKIVKVAKYLNGQLIQNKETVDKTDIAVKTVAEKAAVKGYATFKDSLKNA